MKTISAQSFVHLLLEPLVDSFLKRWFYVMFTFCILVVPGAPPSDVTAVAKSTTSINISWSEVPWQKRNGDIIEYNLQVFNSSLHNIYDYTVLGNETSHVVENLDVFSNYSAKVQAVTKPGQGPFSGLVNATTHLPGN